MADTAKKEIKKVSISDFIGMISITDLNKFVIEKMYAKNTETKTPSSWNTELKKVDGLVFKFNDK